MIQRNSQMPLATQNRMQRYFVGSGSFEMGFRSDRVLEAVLGSCVGVALCDRQAGIGGLIHLLLSEPLCTDNPCLWRPLAYARTGLPLFIRALCDAGASKARLEASVAGGALMRPLRLGDLTLDIGGRTTEAVETTLKEESIRILSSETGGYCGYRMSLDLSSLETFIEPCVDTSATIPVPTRSERINLEKLRTTIDRVRPIPQTALKIIRMLHDGKSNTRSITKEVMRDQVISARTIQMSNSAFAGPREKIDSIERAMLVLGETRFLLVVMSSAFKEPFSGSEQGYSLCKGGLFKHALGTAEVSMRLAELSGRVPPDLAYTAGLLHDIGKVVLDQFMAPLSPLFYRKVATEDKDLCHIEHEVIGVSHAQAGALLAERWQLPKTLEEVIRSHHEPWAAASDTSLCHLVHLADLIMSMFMVGLELEKLETERIEESILESGLRGMEFPELLSKVFPQTADAEPGNPMDPCCIP